MKKILYLVLALLFAQAAFAQNYAGDWGGVLTAGGTELRIVFHITQTPDGYTSAMDSPDQGVKGIPVTSTTVEDGKLKLTIAAAGIEYTGTLNEDQAIAGVFRQAGQSFDLLLTRDAAKTSDPSRPQEPKPPFPYYSEEVVFRNPAANNIRLAGTLTLPKKKGKFPVVVLISGSGPQNRNEELLGHQPFLVLADHLTRQGIGVLRFDDRGAYASEGDFATATTFDFATDAEAAIAYLETRKEVDKDRIGLIGHSEGGVIAPIVASRNTQVDFIVLLAGTGIRGAELLLMQQELIGRANGVPEAELQEVKAVNRGAFDIVLANEDPAVIETKLRAYLNEQLALLPDSLQDERLVEQTMSGIDTPWMLTFLRYDPAVALQKVKCPVLAVNGSKDLQVPASENLAAIKAALENGGNKRVTVQQFDGLNHLFQECTTGSPNEYAKIEQTFSPLAMQAVSDWILSVTAK
jgi:uncharacterized protein